MSERSWAWLVLALKVGITTVLLYYLVSKVRIGPMLSQIATLRPSAALGAILLTLVQLALGSVRWRSISVLLEVSMTRRSALRFTLIGQFFNQLLPTAFGGDAVRAWLVSTDRATLGRAVRGVVCDRMVGLVALLIIISVAFIAVSVTGDRTLPVRGLYQATALVGIPGLFVLYFFGPALARQLLHLRWSRALGLLVGDLHAALFPWATGAGTLGTSFAAHVAAVAAIWLCVNGMGIALGFGAAITVIPVIVLVSMAPISLAGWGVREGAMVVGLGALGVDPANALAVSVAYGLVQIAVAIPGGLLWLAGPRTRLRP